jgi:hypothetical protein
MNLLIVSTLSPGTSILCCGDGNAHKTHGDDNQSHIGRKLGIDESEEEVPFFKKLFIA